MQIQDAQKFSIENLSILKSKFKIDPRDSFLAYGGKINGIAGQYIAELYHVIPPTVLPGSVRIKLVDNIKYFADNVVISTGEEAINFVRLLTAPQLTIPMNDHLGPEVLIKEDFTPSDWLGEDLYLPRYHSGYKAVISRKDAGRINVFSAKCTKSDVYKISRFIFQRDEKGLIKMKYGTDANLILLEEEVTPKGQYKIVKKTVHTYNANSVKWDFPFDY